MLKKIKLLILCAAAACLFFAAACAAGGVTDNRQKRPVPDVDFSNGVGSESAVLTKDASGLFSTTLGVTDVTYGRDIPAIYAALDDYAYPKTGVQFDANISGSQIYYNKVLDLNEIDGNIVTFEVLHNDTSQVSEVTAELIDIYDSSRKIEVSWSFISSETVTDTLVSCNSVSAAGCNTSTEDFGKPRLQYGATNYLSNLFEQIITWYGNGHEHMPFHFTFDMEENQVRADVGSPADQKNFLLLDVDDPVHMGTDVFEGFTTGEVYLRLTLADFDGGGSIVVTSIGGDDLSGEEFALEPINTIKVNFENRQYAETMPEGLVGQAYPVPAADSHDLIRGEYTIQTTVLGPDGNTVSMADGAFVPETEGTYQIVYSARDINGYRIDRRYAVTVKEELAPLTIVSDTAEATVFSALSPVKLPVAHAEGGSGIADLQTQYLFNGAEIQPDAAGNARFDGAGTLQMKVQAEDYLGNRTEKTFEYSVASNPTIRLSAAIPKGVEEGSVFTVPDFTVEDGADFDYTDKEILVNGTAIGEDRKYTVSGTDPLTVDYYAARGEAHELHATFRIDVVASVTEEDASGLFITEGSMRAAQQTGGVEITATSSENEMIFAHPISAATAELSLRDTDAKGYEYLEVMLSDSYDASISVVFRVYNTAILTGSFRVQNASGSFEQYKYPISSTVAVTERKHFYYDNSDHSIYNLNLNKIAEIRYCTDGTVFNGFPSGTMNVSIRFGGVKSASGLLIVKMGNQPFDANTLSYGDLIPPQLAPVSNVESGNVVVNTQFVVPAATAADVLTLDSSISVSFTSPTGESLLADADCTESRTFTLDKLGNYTLIYRIEDANGVVNNWRYNITVVDNVPPEIVVDSDYSAAYRAGDTVTLAGMTATDNTDTAQALHTYILIINPQHDYVMFTPGEQYTFETSGRYRIQYCARDTSGNYGIVEFVVTVN